MKWQRCSTFTPGHAVSTMNAVICRFSFPFTTLDGVRAITTSSSALVPLVHHSFSPLSTHAWPSGVGTAVVSMAAGSEPTPGSVSANAEIAPFARRGRDFFLWASLPDKFRGCGPPIGGCADKKPGAQPSDQETRSLALAHDS